MGASDGVVEVDGQGVGLGPSLTLEAFEGGPLHARASYEYNPFGTSVRVDGVRVRGREVTLSLNFKDGLLRRLGLFVHLEGDGTSWDDWTHAQEMRRKREHEALAEELFGVALTPRVVVVDGKRVERMFPEDEWARAASCAWGEVVSGYDSKGGFSEMYVRWGTAGAAP